MTTNKKMKIELKRLDDAFHFEAISETGNIVHMDAGENLGGHNKGVRPMQMLLMGLGGCSAIDVILILKKHDLFQCIIQKRLALQSIVIGK